MRILIALPGLHRVDRGAEIAFIAVADELARCGDRVTLIGSGPSRPGAAYRYIQAPSISRDHFEKLPSLPVLRNEYCYEELTFAPSLLRSYRPSDYDVTLTCSYPFTNWILRRRLRGFRPPHVFVTHNGDWPPSRQESEFRLFGCEGLICINPDFFDRNKDRWNCRLIPNGVDTSRFRPGPPCRQELGLPEDRLLVLMVSALIPNKRIEAGIEAVSRVPNAHLVLAGDGPLRSSVLAAADRLLPGRFTLLSVPPNQMPQLYQSADVFLQASKDEPFPLVFLEAMASGVPIVAHDIARVRWFIGDDEFLVNMSDVPAIARCIEEAYARGAMGRTRRLARAADFSWAKIAGLYRAFLEEVIINQSRQ